MFKTLTMMLSLFSTLWTSAYPIGANLAVRNMGSPLVNQEMQINTSPNRIPLIDFLKLSHEVRQGYVCASPDDIMCIDGLCNKDGEAYWSIQVNGNYKDYNSKSLVSLEDKVEIHYLPTEAFVEER